MKIIILTISLFVLSTTLLISAPVYKYQVEILTNSQGNKYISEISDELVRENYSEIIGYEFVGTDEISSLNSSLMKFQSLERGRRILERKYNLYT